MNHITRLTADLAAARGALEAKAEIIELFHLHLASDKFAGFDPDGSRRDWIAVTDVRAWLACITDAYA